MSGGRTPAEIDDQEALFPALESISFGPAEALMAPNPTEQSKERGREFDMCHCRLRDCQRCATTESRRFPDIPDLKLLPHLPHRRPTPARVDNIPKWNHGYDYNRDTGAAHFLRERSRVSPKGVGSVGEPISQRNTGTSGGSSYPGREYYLAPGAPCRCIQTVPRLTNGSLPSDISVRTRKLRGDAMNVVPFSLTFLPLKVNGAACQ